MRLSQLPSTHVLDRWLLRERLRDSYSEACTISDWDPWASQRRIHAHQQL